MEQNLSLYRIFYVTAAAKNISRAAEELFISQPAISKSIKKLEENLGTVLFVRSSRGVELTDEGKLLYEQVKIAFDAIAKGEEHLKTIHQLGIGQIKIGASTTLCKHVLLPFLKDFTLKYPHVQIMIQCQSTLHTIKLLEKNEIDIGLIGKPDSYKNLTLYSLGEIEDIFVATDSYIKNLSLREGIDAPNLFASGNLMLLDKENLTRQYIEQYLSFNHIETHHILEVNDMDLLIDFSRIGLGIACVIKEFVQEDLDSKKLIQIPLPISLKKRNICFAHLTNTPLSRYSKAFLDFCTKSS